MKFLTNTHDPKDKNAKMYLALTYDEMSYPQGREVAWKHHLEYLSDKFIGEPQATTTYTVEQLKAMGMVGVYKIDYTLKGEDAKEFIRSIQDMDKL